MNIEQIDNFFKYRNKKFVKKIKTEQELKSEKEAYFYLFEKYLNKILKYYTFNLEAYIISTLNKIKHIKFSLHSQYIKIFLNQ